MGSGKELKRGKGELVHEDEATTHVSSAVVMRSSLFIAGEMTRMLPCRKLGSAMLIVAVSTKRTSCARERKAAGRALGSKGMPHVGSRGSRIPGSRIPGSSLGSDAGGVTFAGEAGDGSISTSWMGLSILLGDGGWIPGIAILLRSTSWFEYYGIQVKR